MLGCSGVMVVLGCLRVLGVRFQGARVLECYDVWVLGVRVLVQRG